MTETTEQRHVVKESDVIRLDRDRGELYYHQPNDTDAKIDDVIVYQGIGYQVTSMEPIWGVDYKRARAKVLALEELGTEPPFALTLKPGDTVVLRSEKTLNGDQLQAIKEATEARFPGYSILVLDASITIGKIAREES